MNAISLLSGNSYLQLVVELLDKVELPHVLGPSPCRDSSHPVARRPTDNRLPAFAFHPPHPWREVWLADPAVRLVVR
jgi:hypothetical protein